MEALNMVTQLDGWAFGFALAFIFMDVATGYAQAVANHVVDSKIMKAGFWHKLALVFAMLAAGMADMAAMVEIDLGFALPIFECACGYVMLMEMTSILENIKKMNPQIADSPLMRLLGTNEGDKND